MEFGKLDDVSKIGVVCGLVVLLDAIYLIIRSLL